MNIEKYEILQFCLHSYKCIEIWSQMSAHDINITIFYLLSYNLNEGDNGNINYFVHVYISFSFEIIFNFHTTLSVNP